MAEYTVEDYRKAAKAAYEAGDIEAAEALIEEGMALEQRLKPAPTGAEIVEQFDDGGRILKSTQTGQETYVTDGYTTSDPARIAQIRAAGGKAGEVYKTSMAEDIISQVGELPARAASAIKGVPFVGSYIDEIIGQFSPEAAQATRAAQEAREIVAPVTTGISRAGVGLATAIPAAIAAPAISVTPLGTSLLSRVAAGTGLGAGVGALEGAIYGYGEGATPQEREEAARQQALFGAGAGAVLGPLGPTIGAIGGKIRGRQVSAPAREIGRQVGAKEQALGLISEAARMDAPTAAANLQRAGRYGSLGQMGPATRNLLDLAASSTSEGAAIARQNIEEVAGLAGSQFNDLLDVSLGGPQAAQQLQDLLMEGTATVRRTEYDKAYQAPIDYATAQGRKLQELLGRLDSDVIARAERLMRLEGQPSRQILAQLDDAGNVIGFETLPDVRQIDYITRALKDVSPTAAPEEKGVLRALSGDIRKTLDEIVPQYKTARDIAGDVISLRDAIDFGSKMLNPKTTRYEVQQVVDGMSKSELTGLKQGLRSQIDEMMANAKASLTDPNQDAREMIKPLKDMLSRASKEKITIILGDEAPTFLRQLDEVYSAMSMRAGVAQQSKTAIRDMAKEAARERIEPTMGQLMGERGPFTGAFEALRREATQTPSQQRAFETLMGEIAEPLTRQKDLTQLLQQMQQLRQAAPQLQRAEDIYEAGKRFGTYGAIGLTPAMQTLIGPR
jgi:hypothetical protein